jgi:hypothetical protein
VARSGRSPSPLFLILEWWLTLFERRDDEYGKEASVLGGGWYRACHRLCLYCSGTILASTH